MDTRTDPGQYYPGGRVMVRPDVAPPQAKVNWSDIEGKPDFSDIAPLPERFNTDETRERVNTVITKLKTAAVALTFALCAELSFGELTVQTAPLGKIYNDQHVVTNVTGTSGVDAATATNIAEAAAASATNGIPRITPADGDVHPADWAANAAWADRSGFADNARYGYQSYDLIDSISGEERTSRKIFSQLDAATETNAAQSAALAALPAAVTNIVREASGGIWDAALEVWWTPRMRNGSLTYEATTNVNLNAEN